MLGKLIKHNTNDVKSESLWCKVEDSIRSEQNLTSIHSGGHKSLSEFGNDFCDEKIAVPIVMIMLIK